MGHRLSNKGEAELLKVFWPEYAQSEEFKKYATTKKGAERKRFTKEQIKHIKIGALKYWGKTLVSPEIIASFRDIKKWKKRDRGGVMENTINDWVDTIINSSEYGELILGNALQQAAEEGKITEMQTYAYKGDISVWLSDLMPYVEKYAKYIGEEALQKAKDIAKNIDDEQAQEDDVEDEEDEIMWLIEQ